MQGYKINSANEDFRMSNNRERVPSQAENASEHLERIDK